MRVNFDRIENSIVKKNKIYNKKDFPSYLPKLSGLYAELFSGSKDLRSKFVRRIASHLELKEDQILLLSQTIEFIHNATLLHDDFIDRSHLRRNKKAAWLKYTPEYAVLAGDYLLTRVMVNLSKYGNLSLIQYTAEVISELIEGEWIQDSLFKDWTVGVETLDRVHDLKTSSLFKWCLIAPFLCIQSSNSELFNLLKQFGGVLGRLFQRSDDLLDFDVRNYEKKSVLKDLKSGYLNSFSAFLFKNVNQDVQKKFIPSQSMENIYNLVGKDFFKIQVTQFDEVNVKLIKHAENLIDEIGKLLQNSQKNLVESFLEILPVLYWRKS